MMTRKHFRRGFVLALMGLALTLTACGAQSKSAEPQNKPVTVTFWNAMSDTYRGDLETLVDDFNASQDKVKVVTTFQGNYGAMQQKIMAAAKAKNLPVMAQTIYSAVPDYQQLGIIQPLDPYIDGQNGFSAADKQDFYPVFMRRGQYDGQYLSFPFSCATQVMFYNRKLLTDQGLAVPKTWDDMLALGDKLKPKGVAALALDSNYEIPLDVIADGYGQPMVDDQGRVHADSPAAIKAGNLLSGMIDDKTALTAGTDHYGNKLLFSGQAATYLGSSAAISLFGKIAPKDFDWATTLIPMSANKHTSSVSGNDLVVFKHATKAQKQGAWQFMRYLTSKQVTRKWAEKTGYLPLRQSAVKTTTYQKYLTAHPAQQAAVEALKYGRQDHPFVGYGRYLTEMRANVDAMTQGTKKPANALHELQQTVTDALK